VPEFDFAVIGAGPGGFDAALRAQELGLKTALIDKADPGGTCLHSGCIPTKSLLASTKLISRMAQAEALGLSFVPPAWDLSSLIQRKNQVVETLKKGMFEAVKRSGLTWISGEASFVDAHRLTVKGKEGSREVEAKNILIATGSAPIPFPGAPFDGKKIFSSTELLEIKTVLSRLLILGGGVVGVEFASIFQALGTKVTLVEMLERLIAAEDEEVSRRLESLFSRKGIEIYTGTRVKTLAVRGKGVEAVLESGKTLEADSALVAVGRKPQFESLNLERAGIKVERGRIEVNEFLETRVTGIFAIGDVTSRSTGLAHGASAEGMRVAGNLKGPRQKMDYRAIPNCIYTDPEVASVGSYRVGGLKAFPDARETKILFSSLGKSQVEGETEGFLKMMASQKDGRLLGVTAVGAHVTELIHEAVLAVRAGLSVRDLAETVHAHPTESEILQKAARKLFIP